MKKLLLLLAVMPLIGLMSCENEEPVTKTYTFRSAIGSGDGIAVDYRLIERVGNWDGEYVCEHNIPNYQAGKSYDFVANPRTSGVVVEVTERSGRKNETYTIPGFFDFTIRQQNHYNVFIGYD